MKKFVSIALITASLAASAQALTLGGDAGYLVDSEAEYLSARLGHTLKTGPALSHLVEVEIGYTNDSESGAYAEFMPVTVNYRAESIAANKLGFYYGAGVGYARTKAKISGWSQSDSSVAAQGFVGLTYQVSAMASLHVGAKYLWIDDVKMFGTKIEVGDDVALSAGLSVKF